MSALQEALDQLRRHAKKSVRDGMKRYNLPADRALGVSVGDIQRVAKRVGKSHELAAALWTSGWYEARMLAAYVDEPERVTSAQMDRWCRDFDSWGICDTVCFVLFDKTALAWSKVEPWSARRQEFVKRAAFALVWGLTVHDKSAGDAKFVAALDRIDAAAVDDRDLVKKAVNMALRAIGKRNAALHAEAIARAKRLAASPSPAAAWTGRNALKELTGPSVARRLAAKRSRGRTA